MGNDETTPVLPDSLGEFTKPSESRITETKKGHIFGPANAGELRVLLRQHSCWWLLPAHARALTACVEIIFLVTFMTHLQVNWFLVSSSLATSPISLYFSGSHLIFIACLRLILYMMMARRK